MRSIDILTSQNVTINYELATLRDRIFAFIIDLIVLIIGCAILQLIISIFFGSMAEYAYYLIYIPFFTFYSLVSEILMDGQTIAKKAMGIKVVKIDGIEPSMNDYLIRWAFRAIDIVFTVGAVACMLISSSAKGQRLGDIIANTTVVKTSPAQKIFLSDILSIRSLSNYKPVYTNVTAFTEADMLLLKEVLDRYNRHRNSAHEDALNQSLQIVKQKLSLEVLPADKPGFIRTLIKDYVALSR